MTKYRIYYQEHGTRQYMAQVYADNELDARRRMKKILGHHGFMINKVTSELFPGSGVWV